MPAKAGIQTVCLSRCFWIPAFAGMTDSVVLQNWRAKPTYPERGYAASVPHITFVPFDRVQLEQFPKLVPEIEFPMMLLLPGDVSLDLVGLRLTENAP